MFMNLTFFCHNKMVKFSILGKKFPPGRWIFIFWNWMKSATRSCRICHKSGCLFRVSEAYYLSTMAYIDQFSILKFLWLPWSVFQQIYFKVKKIWQFFSNPGQFSGKKRVQIIKISNSNFHKYACNQKSSETRKNR